jgi:hypothetical protein
VDGIAATRQCGLRQVRGEPDPDLHGVAVEAERGGAGLRATAPDHPDRRAADDGRGQGALQGARQDSRIDAPVGEHEHQAQALGGQSGQEVVRHLARLEPCHRHRPRDPARHDAPL